MDENYYVPLGGGEEALLQPHEENRFKYPYAGGFGYQNPNRWNEDPVYEESRDQ